MKVSWKRQHMLSPILKNLNPIWCDNASSLIKCLITDKAQCYYCASLLNEDKDYSGKFFPVFDCPQCGAFFQLDISLQSPNIELATSLYEATFTCRNLIILLSFITNKIGLINKNKWEGSLNRDYVWLDPIPLIQNQDLMYQKIKSYLLFS